MNLHIIYNFSNNLFPYLAYLEKPVRFVPSKLVEPYVTKSNSSVRGTPNDWDIMYLKMLSIYCENNSQQYITRDSQIILLDGLLYSKTNSQIAYEDFKGPVGQNSWQT